jgi:hypothetical protein
MQVLLLSSHFMHYITLSTGHLSTSCINSAASSLSIRCQYKFVVRTQHVNGDFDVKTGVFDFSNYSRQCTFGRMVKDQVPGPPNGDISLQALLLFVYNHDHYMRCEDI